MSRDHVVTMDGGGCICRHCGGEVNDEGNAMDMGEDPGTSSEVAESIEKQGNPLDATFASAVKRSLNSKKGA